MYSDPKQSCSASLICATGENWIICGRRLTQTPLWKCEIGCLLVGGCFQGRTNWFLRYLREETCKQEAPAINKSEHFFSFSFPHAHGTHKRAGAVKSQYVVLMRPEWKCDWGDAKAWWRKRFVLMSMTGRVGYYLFSLRWFVVSMHTIATVRLCLLCRMTYTRSFVGFVHAAFEINKPHIFKMYISVFLSLKQSVCFILEMTLAARNLRTV